MTAERIWRLAGRTSRHALNRAIRQHDFGPPFDDGQTTGVVIISASSITITITHNVIFNNAIGIYLAQVPPAAITAIITAHRFFRVAIHVKIVS